MEELTKVHKAEKANIQNAYQQEILQIQQEFEGQYQALHDKMHQTNLELSNERSKSKSELVKHKQTIMVTGFNLF